MVRRFVAQVLHTFEAESLKPSAISAVPGVRGDWMWVGIVYRHVHIMLSCCADAHAGGDEQT